MLTKSSLAAKSGEAAFCEYSSGGGWWAGQNILFKSFLFTPYWQRCDAKRPIGLSEGVLMVKSAQVYQGDVCP